MGALIAYFSRRGENYVSGKLKELSVGNTEVAAGMLQQLTGADLFQLEPVHEYPKSYNACIDEAQADQLRDARPELKRYPESLDGYDTIYLGYPNYWGTMPMPVFTFLEHFDFSGKTILPFCTHEGSGLGRSERDIKRLCPGASVKPGLALHGGSVGNALPALHAWLGNYSPGRHEHGIYPLKKRSQDASGGFWRVSGARCGGV